MSSFEDFTGNSMKRTKNTYIELNRMMRVQFSLDMLGKITCFTRGEQVID